jgi:hypothetical protein
VKLLFMYLFLNNGFWVAVVAVIALYIVLKDHPAVKEALDSIDFVVIGAAVLLFFAMVYFGTR